MADLKKAEKFFLEHKAMWLESGKTGKWVLIRSEPESGTPSFFDSPEAAYAHAKEHALKSGEFMIRLVRRGEDSETIQRVIAFEARADGRA